MFALEDVVFNNLTNLAFPLVCKKVASRSPSCGCSHLKHAKVIKSSVTGLCGVVKLCMIKQASAEPDVYIVADSRTRLDDKAKSLAFSTVFRTTHL